MYGANQSMCQLILELQMLYGIKALVLVPKEGDICIFLKEHNIDYLVSHYYWWVNENRGIFQWLLNIRKQFLNIKRVQVIYNKLNDQTFDIVYSNSIVINIGAMLSKKFNCKHVWHIRENLKHYNFKFSLGDNYSKHFLKNAADKYILISYYLLNAYEALLPFDKTIMIYNGIDTDRARSKKIDSNTSINLCIMGVLSEQKNAMDAIKALEQLINTYSIKNIKLHLIGSHKTEYKRLIEDFVEQKHIAEHLVIHGHKNNIDELLEQMDIGLMCSRDEAFGRVTVEYMMHSMPVIASDSGANKELIVNGYNGFVYTIYNAEELAKHILYLNQNKSLINEFGKRAQAFAIENFSSEKNAQKIYALISNL